MSKKRPEDNTKKKDLLNNSDIELISSLFLDIDKKVIFLHKCSTNDFLALTQSFKKHHDFIKTIISVVSNIFEVLDLQKFSPFVKTVENYDIALKTNLADFDDSINKYISIYNELYEIFNAAYIPCNNIKQDLGTLKLALTNIRIEIESSKPNSRNNSSQLIDKNIDTINHIINHPGSTLTDLNRRGKECIQNIKLESEILVGSYKKCISRINSFSDLLKEVIVFVDSNTNVLEEKSNIINDGISTIITNLQYEDIIKQRIEHIQLTHQEILNKLNKISNDKSSNLSENKAHLLVNIKEVTGLQAAQLIHANKQYQGAIEKITKQFEVIANAIENVGEIYLKLKSLLPANLKENLSCLYEESPVLTGNNIFQKNNSDPISHIDIVYLQIAKEYYGYLTEISNFRTFLENLYKNISINVLKSSGLLKQIRSIIDDIGLQIDKIQTIILKVDNFFEMKKSAKSHPIQKFEESFKTILEKKDTMFKEVIDFDQKFITPLHSNISKAVNQNTFDEIRESVHTVKYYNYFEKTIEEIINALNTAYQKLYNDTLENVENTIYNMEYIKKRYTMESEFLIHDYVVNSQLDSINKVQHDIHKKIERNLENDDNLELF